MSDAIRFNGNLQYRDNLPDLLKQLSRAGITLQEAGARTLTVGAKWIALKYKAKLPQTFRLRAPKFTLGSVRVFEAHARRSSGELRELRDINAQVGVINMKGGRIHYLAKQETGGSVKGMRKTAGRVPIPLVAARQGGRISAPVAARYRIDKANIIQLKKLHGLPTPRQYAAMRDMMLQGKLDPKNLYQTDQGIFSISRKGSTGYSKGAKLKKFITMVRDAKETTVHIKAQPVFREAVGTLTEARMIQAFQSSAKNLLQNL